VVWWSEFLATDPEVRVRFPAQTDFLTSSGSGTGFTQPREYTCGATWKKKLRLRSRKQRIRQRGTITLTTWHPLSAKFGSNFEEQWSLGQYSSLAEITRNPLLAQNTSSAEKRKCPHWDSNSRLQHLRDTRPRESQLARPSLSVIYSP
jgi:hypothetical protein